jgi:hypothetical protein
MRIKADEGLRVVDDCIQTFLAVCEGVQAAGLRPEKSAVV